jgi:beta-lactamase regulating signal transducer with metallopeptidase domain
VTTLLYLGLANAVSATVLALCAALAGSLCRRPGLRHGLWLLVLLKLVTPPFVPVSIPLSSTNEPDNTVAAGFSQLPTGPDAEMTAELSLTSGTVPADSSTLLPSPETQGEIRSLDRTDGGVVFWPALLLICWMAGSGIWLTLALWRLLRFQKALRLLGPAPSALQEQSRRLASRLGLARCPAVWLVPAPVSPMLWALAKTPRILIPAGLWNRLTQEQRETLLAHELAHLQRRDHWVRLLELVVLGLYWWHPLAWWARRKLREAEEECCDAWVLRALPSAGPAYAGALLEAVTFLSEARAVLPPAASGIGHVRLLQRRLTMILRGKTFEPLGVTGVLILLGLGVVLLPLLPSWGQTEPPAALQEPAAVPAGTPAPVPLSESSPAAVGPAEPQAQPGQPHAVREGVPEHLQMARDEVEVLESQLEIKRAEIREIEVQREGAERTWSIYKKFMKEQVSTVVAAVQAQSEVELLATRLATKRAEYHAIELRLKQARRRLESLQGAGDSVRHSPQPGQPGGPGPGSMMGPGGPGDRMGHPGSMMGGRAAPRGMMGPGAAAGGPAGPMPAMIGMMRGMTSAPTPAGSMKGSFTSPDNEQRLRDVERKLDALLREVGALRRELKPVEKNRESDPVQ